MSRPDGALVSPLIAKEIDKWELYEGLLYGIFCIYRVMHGQWKIVDWYCMQYTELEAIEPLE